jgi:HlyD family secretion protein
MKFGVRRWLGYGISLVVLGLIGWAGYYWWQKSHQPPRYVTAAVTRGDIQRTVTMTGALNPVITVQVGSYVSGIIKSLGCDFGTEVVENQVCAKVDPLPYQAVVDEDKAQVDTALAQLKHDQAALAYLEVTYERDKALLKEGIVSQDTVDSDQSNVEQGRATIILDKATIVERQAALEAAALNLKYTDIVSPVVGTVITRNIDVGQTVVSSTTAATLFLIGKDLTKMQVDTNVSEADIGTVKVGQTAYFTVQAFPTKTFIGKVRQIRQGPITVQNVVTYDVVIDVDNPGRLLFPGMTADTHIVTAERKDVFRVPLPAIRFTPEGFTRTRGGGQRAEGQGRPEGQARQESQQRPAGETRPEGQQREARREGGGQLRQRIWIMRDGALKPIPVTVGLDDGALVEVSGEGLEEGDKVVVNEARTEEARVPDPNTVRRQQAPGQGGFRL